MDRARRSRCWNGCAPIPPDGYPPTPLGVASVPDPLSQAGRDGPCPIIVTAQLGAADQAWADALRHQYFPPDRNQLPAHLTLFHHLPPSALAEIQARLAMLARGPRPRAVASQLYSLGRGVAIRVECPELLAMRDELAECFHALLTPQDKARPRLHITIQNKVTPEEARVTLNALAREFRPRPLVIAGLAAWEYRGGPWSLIRRYMFRG